MVDYYALLLELKSGRLSAGIDVWPEEPISADEPYRAVENVVISGHRAGGVTAVTGSTPGAVAVFAFDCRLCFRRAPRGQ